MCAEEKFCDLGCNSQPETFEVGEQVDHDATYATKLLGVENQLPASTIEVRCSAPTWTTTRVRPSFLKCWRRCIPFFLSSLGMLRRYTITGSTRGRRWSVRARMWLNCSERGRRRSCSPAEARKLTTWRSSAW